MRLPGYNYRNPDPYFFTTCTADRRCLFGEIRDGVMCLNELGRIVQACWDAIPRHFPHVVLDAFQIMPNHVHGIFWIVQVDGHGAGIGPSGALMLPFIPSVGMTYASSLQDRQEYAQTPWPNRSIPRGPKSGSAGAIIGSFKSAVTRLVNRERRLPGTVVWQKNYHERIIRTQASLERIRRYIALNPINWYTDRNRHHVNSSNDR